MKRMDIHSLIHKIKSSGLNVNADSLELVFSSIADLLTCHDEILSRLPKVEAAQGELRTEFNRLRFAIESTQRVNSGASHSPVKDNAASDNSDTYGIEKCDLASIQLKQANVLSSANDIAVSSSLREIKAHLRRLQQDRDDGIVTSMDVDERINSTKNLVFEVQQKLASAASMEQLQTLKAFLAAQYGQTEHRIHEYTSSIQTEVEGRINQNLSEVKSWFSELEAAMKQRQIKLETRVASCAAEYDVACFRESIECDVASLARKASFLDDTARAQGRKIVSLQQKNAIIMLHRNHSNWTQKALKVALFHWKQTVKRQIDKESQVRLVRKILTNIISRRKRNGFGRWVRYLDWHRKIEHRKLEATSLICERLGSCFSAPISKAFNQWRRLTLLDRVEISDGVHVIEENRKSSMADATSIKPLHDLLKIMASFNGDVKGAMYALAQEIMTVKYRNIPSLHQEWCAKNQKMMSTIHTDMNVAIQKVQETADEFRKSIGKRVDSCAIDLPVIHSEIEELSNIFDSTKVELENVDQRHTVQIDAILANERSVEQKLIAIQEQAQNSALQITSLMGHQTKSNEFIQQLRDAIATNEKRHDDERESFQQALYHFGDELLKTKVSLGHTRVRCDFLEKELTEVKLELVHFQDASQAESDRVRSHIHHLGVFKPSLNRIVSVGHAYETLCKEKNYVPGINITVIVRSTTTMKMKRSEEKVKISEDVEIPSEIAAFAHDYAAWIAYHADHESLIRLIAGNNPENQVYAEDDIISRRKEICVELKSELGILLERASAIVLETSNKHDSTNNSTRGMGLRWEARAIFLARIVDAVNVALSKHDQILLPASTRIGRVGTLSSANVNVCMACDRPMRTKTLRSHSSLKSTPNAEDDLGVSSKLM